MISLLFLVFEDDMLELAVGDQAQGIVASIEKFLIQKELGVELNNKPEANRSFDTTFEFIGEEFNTSDASNVRPRPAKYVLKNMDRYVTWVHDYRCRLVDRTQLQTVVGLLTFCRASFNLDAHCSIHPMKLSQVPVICIATLTKP